MALTTQADTGTPKTRARRQLACASLVAAAALALSACDPPSSDDRKSERQSYTITEKATGLKLATRGGDVTITASDRTDVKVTEKIHYSDDAPEPTHAVADGAITLDSGACSKGNCGVDYTIELPAALALDISSDGGDVEVRGTKGDLSVATEGGRGDLSELAAFKVTARTAGGALKLAFRTKPTKVTAATDGGDVTMTVPEGSYAVRADTSGGDKKIEVGQDHGAAEHIQADTEGGDRKSVV